jgi:hypothetical protein
MIYHDLSFYCGLFLIRVGPLLKDSVFSSLFLPLWLKSVSVNSSKTKMEGSPILKLTEVKKIIKEIVKKCLSKR